MGNSGPYRGRKPNSTKPRLPRPWRLAVCSVLLTSFFAFHLAGNVAHEKETVCAAALAPTVTGPSGEWRRVAHRGVVRLTRTLENRTHRRAAPLCSSFDSSKKPAHFGFSCGSSSCRPAGALLPASPSPFVDTTRRPRSSDGFHLNGDWDPRRQARRASLLCRPRYFPNGVIERADPAAVENGNFSERSGLGHRRDEEPLFVRHHSAELACWKNASTRCAAVSRPRGFPSFLFPLYSGVSGFSPARSRRESGVTGKCQHIGLQENSPLTAKRRRPTDDDIFRAWATRAWQVADLAARLLEVEGNLDCVRENEPSSLTEAPTPTTMAASSSEVVADLMERVAALERQTAGPEQCGQLFSEEVEDVKRRLDWLEDWSASPLSSYMLEDLEDWDGQRSTTTATASIDDLTACRFYSIEDRLERLEEAVWSWEAEGGEGTYEQPGQAYGTGKAWPGSEERQRKLTSDAQKAVTPALREPGWWAASMVQGNEVPLPLPSRPPPPPPWNCDQHLPSQEVSKEEECTQLLFAVQERQRKPGWWAASMVQGNEVPLPLPSRPPPPPPWNCDQH